MSVKFYRLIGVALATLTTAAHAEKFDNWNAVTSFTAEAKVCLIDSLDMSNAVDAAFSVTDMDKVQLRMTDESGPNTVLPEGKVEVVIDGSSALTATGANEDAGALGKVLAVKLTSQQLFDFLDKAKTSHRMTITLGDGSAHQYVTDAGMVFAYMAMSKCLDAMMHAAR